MTVQRDALDVETYLAKGGFGAVYKVTTPSGLIPSASCAFKEWKPTKLDQVVIDNVAVLIDYRRRMDAADRQLLDNLTTWPLDTVTEPGGGVVGYLMRIVPDDFFENDIIQIPHNISKPRSFTDLTAPEVAERSGVVDIVAKDDLVERIRMCAWMCRIFALLHRHNITYGDINEKNVLYSSKHDPPVMLVDIDPARVEGRSPQFTQANLAHMVAPENTGKNHTSRQDELTDRYKIARLCAQILISSRSLDPQFRALRPVSDREGFELFERGLRGPRADRPSAAEWYGYFYRRIAAMTRPPEVHAFTVEPEAVQNGATVTVRWHVAGHDSLVVIAPDGQEYHTDSAANEWLTVNPGSSGSFRVIARNRYGSVESHSVDVYLYEPPTIDVVTVPAGPAASSFPTLDLATLADTLAGSSAPDTVRNFLAGRPAIPLALPFQSYDEALTTPGVSGMLTSPDFSVAFGPDLNRKAAELAAQALAANPP
ncbi:hypothetical protein [Gordonia aquimaris]|uniref:Protein kinase domain-containing protein n=1 Tax=Gordonia aquimaris TaxID=2984863 RepID=A0A9X3D7J2_9ACTN|nr:hypothetical protein [Gordonia aquimaris]MCX2965404.1 hypothetical protein [Gordonia aquimaris]